MTVVAAYLYRNGHRVREVSIDEKIESAEQKSEFAWIGIADPSEEEMSKLAANYDLHPLAVEDAIKANQLPKIDVYDDQLFVVARTAHLVDDHIDYGETAIFVGHSHIISVRHGSTRAHTTLREQLEKTPRFLMHGVDYVLHAILDFVVDGYLPLITDLEEEVLEMETKALNGMLGREEVNRIFTVRRELIRFQRILGPMGEVAQKLARLELPSIDAEVRIYFRDVQDHVRRTQARVDSLREVLTSVFELSTLLEQQQQGRITRQLAAWAAILAVPTAIAGIYGMNFENMPELTTRYGYFVIVVTIGVICLILYRRFRKLGWL
ncbi:magnesium and cobalt transport protein CorA [Sphingomonas edaphi]|uniref:Magnesium and cobalt transport protein CorA n=1 Tax=Sphingomonas edaphi TaxID=2315689 RepID=A0A418PZ51_9SPHN|nr:magnesium and cobalt transport protein CorA [Sphingomonas edaphi]RIX27390.1 magnesium and cobalt transport protein CorA [Sphingomonas edaphi]